MDNTESSGRWEFWPVHCLSKPLQIVTEKFVVRCALVHKCIAESDSSVENRISALQTIPNFAEYA